jgi:uncharacterized protein (DUF2147 family)
MFRTLLALILIGSAYAGAAADRVDGSEGLAAADPVEGLWATGGSLVRVTELAGALSMTVVALERPVDAKGLPLIDVENPEPTLRTQPILGMNIISGYRMKKDRWRGKIYDPESGKTYSSHMRVVKGKLEMRGYIGTPLLGKTKRFRPVSDCSDDIQVMLRNSQMTGYCGI